MVNMRLALLTLRSFFDGYFPTVTKLKDNTALRRGIPTAMGVHELGVRLVLPVNLALAECDEIVPAGHLTYRLEGKLLAQPSLRHPCVVTRDRCLPDMILSLITRF